MTLDSGKLIGVVGLRTIDTQLRHGFIGYVVSRDYWGKGFATEVANGILSFGFGQLNFHRISTDCDVENIASIRVLEKIGMTREGIIRDHHLLNGKWRDSYNYAIIEDEWTNGESKREKRHLISGVNHITLSINNVEDSFVFYRDLLDGFIVPGGIEVMRYVVGVTKIDTVNSGPPIIQRYGAPYLAE